MKPLNSSGFTIIETMLFLGITGLLVLGILVGTGNSINIQRYHDSVASLRSFLQQQYSEVANVSIESGGSTCSGITSKRGQSECFILGRYISSADSKTITIKQVIGHIDTDTAILSDDIDAINQYAIQVSPTVSETYDIEWGSSIANASGSPLAFSMLIIRSPSSGIIRTFIDNQRAVPDNQIGSLVVPTTLENTATICIDSNGLFTGPKMAVFIDKNSSSASGVESLGEESGCR